MSACIFWSTERLYRVGLALLIALVVACAFKYSTDADNSSALLRGDFPGIISPAIVLSTGQTDRLYDRDLHHAIQRKIWPSFADEMYISVYPPFFGVLLLPLARLDPLLARHMWTLLSLSCYILALLLLRPASKALRENFLFLAVTLLLFAPILFGILGGQNSAMSLLLLVGGLRLLDKDSRRSDFFAGVLFGLWLFKPQFGVLAGAYLLLTRKFTALAGFALIAVLYWLAAARYVGNDWMLTWLAATKEFAAINFSINSNQMASFAGAVFSAKLVPEYAVLPLSLIFSGLMLALVWKSKARSPWLFGPLVVLISPQTLFYDLSIAFVSCLPFVNFANDREINIFLICGIIAAGLFALRDYCSFALPFLMGLGAFAFVFYQAQRKKTGLP